MMVFPTANGRFHEWEDNGMIGALSDHIENGWLQIYCVDNITAESWFATEKEPKERIRRHIQFNNYILHEVMPFSHRKNNKEFLITAGADFGAYYAVTFALRHPHLVGRTIGLSGFYDLARWADGYNNEKIYENNPCWFIPKEHDVNRLNALQRQDIILAVGKKDAARANNQRLSGLLWDKKIGNALRIWNGQAHDWANWMRMLRLYIDGHD
jgi:esterase/lipase superfamily enzyme